jgi:transcriptional regulator with XRE-family HTH domain
MAQEVVTRIGHEVVLGRTTLGLTRRAAAGIAGVAPSTYERVERGDASIGIGTACQVADAVGLRLWVRAFPARTPSLRDTGQLHIVEYLRELSHPSLKPAIEVGLGNLRAADLVFFSPTEIIHAEIERLIADFQDQYRRAAAKRDELAAHHARPVRLIMVVEDTQRNRQAVRDHAALINSALPASSRVILRAMRTGEPLGRDGLLWVRAGARH